MTVSKSSITSSDNLKSFLARGLLFITYPSGDETLQSNAAQGKNDKEKSR